MAERVGFIGLGIMGSRQAASLRRAGFELTVVNRTRATAEAWAAEHGAEVAASPREAGARASVVITMVVDGQQVQEVLLGEQGAVHDAAPGTLFIDMSTIAPGTARALDAALRERGHAFVDAPVTGSAPKAEAGTLTIMCGGADADVERAMPLFRAMGEKIVHAGAAGQGQAVKVISQGVTAVHCATLAQALVLARQAGVDLEALLDVMDGGSSDSTMRALKGRPMVEHDFEPLFKLAHMLKDVELCLAEARAAGSSFPFVGLAAELYGAGMGRGLADRDFAAVLEVIEGLAGAEV